MEDYVLEIDNALPKEICDRIIERYKKDSRKTQSKVGGASGEGEIDKEMRRSLLLQFSDYDDWADVNRIIYDVIGTAIQKYISHIKKIYKKYETMNEQITHTQLTQHFSSMQDEGYFIQEYKEGDFYHWHTDHSNTLIKNRTLSFVLYLNTLDENQGGCTDFIHGQKIRPFAGKLLVFPSDWKYVHRSAVVKNGGIKYTIGTWATTN